MLQPDPSDAASAAGCWVAYCDGSAVPNPGRMACGVVILAPDGTRHTLSVSAGSAIGCNNEAELLGVTLALERLLALGARQVRLHSDNSVVVARLSRPGSTAPDIAWLASAFDRARECMTHFDRVEVKWIPRHRNAEADALARSAAGLPPKAVLPPGRRRLSKAQQKIE